MMKRKYASEHDISPLYPVVKTPMRIAIVRIYNALCAVISDGFSDTVRVTLKDGIDIYKSVHVSISNFALLIKTVLYHVHGEEEIEISFATDDSDAFIDIKCNYKFTKDEISDIESALDGSGFEFVIDGGIHLKAALRACGTVAAYSFTTDPIRHYIYYVIHADSFKA